MKFNYHIIILLLLIVRLFTPSTAKASQNYINNLYPSDNDEFETLMEKIRKDFAQNPLIDEFLHKYDTAAVSPTWTTAAATVQTGNLSLT